MIGWSGICNPGPGLSGFVTRTSFHLQQRKFLDFWVGSVDVHPSVPSAPIHGIHDSKSITVLAAYDDKD